MMNRADANADVSMGRLCIPFIVSKVHGWAPFEDTYVRTHGDYTRTAVLSGRQLRK